MRSKQYVTGIDGVRTLAVLGVIIYHLLPTTLPGGAAVLIDLWVFRYLTAGAANGSDGRYSADEVLP